MSLFFLRIIFLRIHVVFIVAVRGRIGRGSTREVPARNDDTNAATADPPHRRSVIAIVMKGLLRVRIAPEDLAHPNRSVYLSMPVPMSFKIMDGKNID